MSLTIMSSNVYASLPEQHAESPRQQRNQVLCPMKLHVGMI